MNIIKFLNKLLDERLTRDIRKTLTIVKYSYDTQTGTHSRKS